MSPLHQQLIQRVRAYEAEFGVGATTICGPGAILGAVGLTREDVQRLTRGVPEEVPVVMERTPCGKARSGELEDAILRIARSLRRDFSAASFPPSLTSRNSLNNTLQRMHRRGQLVLVGVRRRLPIYRLPNT